MQPCERFQRFGDATGVHSIDAESEISRFKLWCRSKWSKVRTVNLKSQLRKKQKLDGKVADLHAANQRWGWHEFSNRGSFGSFRNCKQKLQLEAGTPLRREADKECCTSCHDHHHHHHHVHDREDDDDVGDDDSWKNNDDDYTDNDDVAGGREMMNIMLTMIIILMLMITNIHINT